MINAGDFPNLTAAMAAADLGNMCAMYLPSGEYNGSNLSLSSKVIRLYGDGAETTKITGRMTVESAAIKSSIEGITMEGMYLKNSRDSVFDQVKFTEMVEVHGASYYNHFRDCDFVGDYALSIFNGTNANLVTGGRIRPYIGGVVIWGGAKPPGQWTFRDISLEGQEWANGDGWLEPFFKLNGHKHTIENCWMEHGNHNDFKPETGAVLFDNQSADCTFKGGWQAGTVTVVDKGTNNTYT